MEETITATYLTLIKKADLYFKYFIFKCGGFKKYPEINTLYQELHDFAFSNSKTLDENKTPVNPKDPANLEKCNALFDKSKEILKKFPHKGNCKGEMDREILEQVLQHAVFAGKESYEVVKNPAKFNVTIQ